MITSTAPPSGSTIGGVADPCFEMPRLAALYDPLDPDRADLLAYLGMAGEFGVRSVLDIGCGTGTLACVLATLGLEVTGLDPAGASLDIARATPGGDRVRWVHGDVTALPPLQVDLAVMTGNVARCSWATTSGRGCSRPRTRRCGRACGWCSRPATRRGGRGRSGTARIPMGSTTCPERGP